VQFFYFTCDRSYRLTAQSFVRTRKHSEGSNLHHSAILNSAESHIWCRNYISSAISVDRIAKFGEDISVITPWCFLLTFRQRLLPSSGLSWWLAFAARCRGEQSVIDFKYVDFDFELWPWPLKSSQWNVAVMLNTCAKFHDNRTCSYREITNKQTYEPTNKLTWSQYLLAVVIKEQVKEFAMEVRRLIISIVSGRNSSKYAHGCLHVLTPQDR